MKDEQFYQLRDLLKARSGLYYADMQRADLLAGVHDAWQETPFTSYEAYIHALHANPIDTPLWKTLLRVLTIGETYFFRNRWHFQALREHILPALIARRRHYGLHHLRIWSAGCATGEEPYSLAILLRELLPDIDQWHINILATDINEAALDKARAGEYGAWSFREETPPTLRQTYFVPHGDRYRILPEVQRMVRFETLNLVDDDYPSGASDTYRLDLIVCRNVTIYFDRTTTREVVTRFHDCLVEAGWLLVGHSEPLTSLYTEYDVHNFSNAVVYRKPERIPAPIAPAILPAEPPTPAQHLSETEQADAMQVIYTHMAAGDREGARQTLFAFLDAMPQHIDALFLLAKLAADEGEDDEVHAILDTIETIDPLVPQAHYLRALLHQQSQQWQDAKAALRRALYADREFALAHYAMGELFYTEGNAAMARRSWQHALAALGDCPADTPLPFGDGMLAGTLIHAIQQRLNRL
ncbi:MAG: CheR family methyltransferase [Anaerolineales bacterium]